MPFKDPQQRKAYRKANRSRDAQKLREWRSKNPDYYKQWGMNNRDRQRDARLRSKYGIGLEQYTQILSVQGGVCAICKKKQDRSLDVDHDHKTGKIRGLLCNNCNRAIGHFKDDPSLCRRAAEYLD